MLAFFVLSLTSTAATAVTVVLIWTADANIAEPFLTAKVYIWIGAFFLSPVAALLAGIFGAAAAAIRSRPNAALLAVCLWTILGLVSFSIMLAGFSGGSISAAGLLAVLMVLHVAGHIISLLTFRPSAQ